MLLQLKIFREGEGPPSPLTVLSVVTVESVGCHADVSPIHVEVCFFPLALTPEEIDLKFSPLLETNSFQTRLLWMCSVKNGANAPVDLFWWLKQTFNTSLKEKESEGMNGRSGWFKHTLELVHLVSYFALYLLAVRSRTSYLFSLSLNPLAVTVGHILMNTRYDN